MDSLFRVFGAVGHDPAVDAWLNEEQDEFGAMARHWFTRMRKCGTDVRELIHDGCPVACVEDAPFAYVNIFTAHLNVGFFRGSSLPDPAGLLQGKGKNMRHVKLKPGAEIDSPALAALIDAAYRDIKARLQAGG